MSQLSAQKATNAPLHSSRLLEVVVAARVLITLSNRWHCIGQRVRALGHGV
jgi:hypothetical protein